LAAFRTSDGRVTQSNETGLDGANLHPVLADSERVYVRGDGKDRPADAGHSFLTAFAKSDLHEIWRHRLSSEWDKRCIALDPKRHRLFIGERRGGIAALDARSGKGVATTKIPESPIAVLIHEDRLFWLGPTGIRALEPVTLNTIWDHPMILGTGNKAMDVYTEAYPYPVQARGSTLYLMSTKSRRLFAIDTRTGRTEWSYAVPEKTDPRHFYVLDHWLVYGVRPYASAEDKRGDIVEFRWLDLGSRRVQGTRRFPVWSSVQHPIAVSSEDTLYISTKEALLAVSGSATR
jgi:outer membrane protein assembly factor BamB